MPLHPFSGVTNWVCTEKAETLQYFATTQMSLGEIGFRLICFESVVPLGKNKKRDKQ